MIDFVMLIGSAAFGAVMRVLFGLWKAYNDRIQIVFDWKRTVVELFASFGFGLFALLAIQAFSIVKLPNGINAAVVAIFGFLGADALNMAVKKLGIKNVTTVFQGSSGLLPRYQKALDYVRENGSISNDEYQSIVKVSDATARRDLVGLVKKKLLTKKGTGKGTRYY